MTIIPAKRKYDSSIKYYGFILDLDKENNVVGIEILDIAKTFKVPKIFIISIVKQLLKM